MGEADVKRVDLWDEAMPGMHYMHSAPRCLADLWSETQNTLYIRSDLGAWWLERPGVVGQSDHPTLADAKVAGDAADEAAWAKVPALMLEEAGLDAEAWRFEYREGARFINFASPALVVEIDVHEGPSDMGRYEAFDGDESRGTFDDPKAAAAALVDAPAPGM